MSAPPMAERAGLVELAERCERASGADRELDARITCALDGVSFLALETIGRSDAQYPGREVIHADAGTCWADEHKGFLPYTASLDAALTLVPEIVAPATPAGRWPATVDLRRHDDGTASVSIASTDCTPEGAEDELWVEAKAATPALALCAAALRALASGAPR